MTTPSSFSGSGLSINVFMPLVQADAPVATLSEEISSYQHGISADGGFTSATFTLSGDRDDAEDWLAYGLGRHIQVHSPSGGIIWEGFVNQIDATIGNIMSSRGPLTSIANRVSVVYTPIIDYGVEPPVTGTVTETVIVEDTDSQDKYGIWEKVVSIGNVLDAEAEYIRDLYLEENAYPDGSTSLSIGSSGGDVVITVGCRGYIDWLGYVYNNTDAPMSVLTDAKLKLILAADPNNIFSTSYIDIDYNGVITTSYEAENKTAKSVIDSILVLGGGADDRWLFGVYGGRKCRYAAASQTLDYFHYVSDIGQRIETSSRESINSWDVMPGKWVALPDYLYGAGIHTFDMRNDPRVFFIEQADFTAPDQITLNGGKVRRLAQYMAKLGLGSL